MLKHSLCFLLLFLYALHETHAVDYTVINNALNTSGGVIFRDKVGDEYAKQTLESATQFIWSIFQQNDPSDRKDVKTVNLFVDYIPGIHVLNKDNAILLSAWYVEMVEIYKIFDVKTEVTGLLYHELAHVWQWRGNESIPNGLLEGIAAYVRLKANYSVSFWAKPGEGIKWDQSYDVTAHFLDYCESLKIGFVAQLYKLLRTGYSDQYFVQILGKPVYQLWLNYKAKYDIVV